MSANHQNEEEKMELVEESTDGMEDEKEEEEAFSSCAQEFMTMQDEIDYEEMMKATRMIEEEAKSSFSQYNADTKEEEPASPVRDKWPADSLLTKDHFTIDTQKCLTCRHDLGYAMPMNRIPKEKYLFCDKEECSTSAILQCFACDKHFIRDVGHFVHRPGNCAYTFPTQIYNFMCKYCYSEQMTLEPGYEETKKQMKEFREYRKRMEAEDPGRDIASLANGPSTAQPAWYRRSSSSSGSGGGGGGGDGPSCYFSGGPTSTGQKRKRVYGPGE